MAGFGASGRNGGWCSALFPTSWQTARRRLLRGRRPADASAPCRRRSARSAGSPRPRASTRTTTAAAPSPWPARRCSSSGSARRWSTAHARGFTEDDERLLEPDEAAAMLAADAGAGRRRSPRTARSIHPSRLVRGLARVVEASGVPIFEQTRGARPSRPAGSRPTPARCAPRWCCAPPRATPPRLAGLRASGGAGVLADGRDRAARRRTCGTPSGCADRPTFTDARHLIIYGQRTADGRLAFGGRGAPYHFGVAHPSVVRRGAAGLRGPPHACSARCCRSCADVGVHPPVGRLPRHRPRLGRLGGARPAHRDRLGRAGTSATASPPPTSPAAPSPTWSPGPTATWSPCPGSTTAAGAWEPEPLRWLGINAGLRAMTFADVEERWTRRPSRSRG